MPEIKPLVDSVLQHPEDRVLVRSVLKEFEEAQGQLRDLPRSKMAHSHERLRYVHPMHLVRASSAVARLLIRFVLSSPSNAESW